MKGRSSLSQGARGAVFRRPARPGATALAAGLTLACLLTACGGSAQVVRRRGDVETSGRAVSPVAYAWFARGLYHERLGHLEQAARDFGAAVAADKKSGSAWAAWGRVLCGLDRNLAFGAFDDGLERAERKGPILLARARCQLGPRTASGKSEAALAALEDVERALLLEPKSPETSALLAECYEHLGKPARAQAVTRGYRLFTDAPLEDETKNPRRAIDEALRDGDLNAAASYALNSMSPGELAARAALLGRADLAQAQATFVLRASPDDLDAQITQFVLGTQSSTNTSGVTPLGDLNLSADEAGSLSPNALVLFSMHLKRHAGRAVAAHFLQENGDVLQNEADPLLVRLAGEVRGSVPQP